MKLSLFGGLWREGRHREKTWHTQRIAYIRVSLGVQTTIANEVERKELF